VQPLLHGAAVEIELVRDKTARLVFPEANHEGGHPVVHRSVAADDARNTTCAWVENTYYLEPITGAAVYRVGRHPVDNALGVYVHQHGMVRVFEDLHADQTTILQTVLAAHFEGFV
jgi:hypothetical protein